MVAERLFKIDNRGYFDPVDIGERPTGVIRPDVNQELFVGVEIKTAAGRLHIFLWKNLFRVRS